MRRKLTSLSFLAFLGLGGLAMAQVTGVVNDVNNFPEMDAEVVVKGTDKVAYTDENGNFTIDAKVGDILIVNGVEYKVTSNNLGVINHKDSSKINLGEAVVLGFGRTSTKPKSMGAIAMVSASELDNRPNSSVLNSLQGTAPGLAINSASGSPGSGKINVKIRGVNSLNASTDPLYVIDGVSTSATQFRNLNVEDIDNIAVLKDAQATSIYGNRGANGVVIITTKGGRFNSGLQIDYSGLTTISQYPKDHYHMANTAQNLRVQNAVGYADYTEAEIAELGKTNTNWNKEFYNSAAYGQQHTVGLRFGGENVNVYSSLGYLEQEGNFKSTDFKRFTFRNTINGKSKNDRFTYSAQVALAHSKRSQLDQETNTGVSNNVIQNPLFGTLLANPGLAPYRYKNGREMYNDIGGNYPSTYVLADIINGGMLNKFTENSVFATVNGRYKLTDFLSVGNRLGIDYKESTRNFARTPNGYLSVLVAANANTEYGGFDQIANTKDVTINNVLDLSFAKSFGESTLTATAFLEYTKAHYIYNSQQQNGLNPLNWKLGAGTGYVGFNVNNPNQYLPSISAQKIDAGTLAYFGTVDYDYGSKYGVSGTVRRDGSYRFSKENRWETFWSVAGRWNLDQEEFLQGTSVRMLKLRASYGITGNQNLVAAANNTNPLFTGSTLTRQLFSASTGYQGVQGFALGTLANENLKWESVTQANIGVDFDILNGILTGSVDVYHKKTKNMFSYINVSAVTGVWSVQGNNGAMSNKGIEALLRANIFRESKFHLSAFVNGAYNKNKIESMDLEDLSGDNVQAVGGVANQWHLYKYVGVNKETGEQQFLDKDGNITEAPTSADRVLTGKTSIAPWTGGFGLNADYKGIFLDVLFSFQAGGWSYDNIYSWIMDPTMAQTYNVSADVLDSWTPTNTTTNVPSMTANNTGLEGSSDRFLYKTDFVKLRNITLGYALSKNALASLPVKSFRIFLTGENLVTWTDWKGFDPEPVQNYSLGVYPNSRSISLGLNIGL